MAPLEIYCDIGVVEANIKKIFLKEAQFLAQ